MLLNGLLLVGINLSNYPWN